MSNTQMSTISEIAALSGNNSKGVSICIPRIFPNITQARIKQAFIALNWGFVERVDVVTSGKTKRAFVHFAPGQFTESTVLNALCLDKEVKIVYDKPWFWKISLSRSIKPDELDYEQVQSNAPTFEIMLGDGAKRHSSGRKLTIDIHPQNDPIAARQAENKSKC